MNTEAFGDNIANGHARAERPIRVLKHDLHIAADRAHLLEPQTLNIVAEKYDRTVRGN